LVLPTNDIYFPKIKNIFSIYILFKMNALLITPTSIEFTTSNRSTSNILITVSGTDSLTIVGQTSTMTSTLTSTPPTVNWNCLTTLGSTTIPQYYQQFGISTNGITLPDLWRVHLGAYVMIATWMPDIIGSTPVAPLTNLSTIEGQALMWLTSTTNPVYQNMARVVILFSRIWGSLLPSTTTTSDLYQQVSMLQQHVQLLTNLINQKSTAY